MSRSERWPPADRPAVAALSLGLLALLAAAVLPALAACSGEPERRYRSSAGPCGDAERVFVVGFYASFAPVGYSAGSVPGEPGFDTHLGYEADLLSALERMADAGLSFERRGIAEWADIWLRAAEPEYDIVAGGITILEARRRDASGAEAIVFTSGHIAFRQSLLVRAADAERLSRYGALTSAERVGALRGTTGEARLLQVTGLTDERGVLAAGVRVETANGDVLADGGGRYVISAAGASPALEGRRRLLPSSGDMPQVIYLGDEQGEAELLAALAAGTIDAVARGEIGNRDAARASAGSFAVTALDSAVEWGGFALDSREPELARCLDALVAYLTEDRRIGYAEWRAAPGVFMQRAERWNRER